MYRVALRKKFTAEHYLPLENGKENKEHSHKYTVEVSLDGIELDGKGYLIDIDEMEKILEKIVQKFEGNTLNELPEFKGCHPTVENFSRVFWEKIRSNLNIENLEALEVKIWETEKAYASYRGEL